MAYRNNKGGFETKDMRGSMFANTRNRNPKAPHYTGKVKINGKEYYISAWNQQSRNGSQYLSLQLADPEKVNQNQPQTKRQQPATPAPTQQPQPQQVHQPQPIAPEQPVNNGFVQRQPQNDGFVRANTGNTEIPF